MAVKVGSLVIDLSANTASFSAAMDKASNLSAKTANDVSKSLMKIGAAGAAMAAAVATGVTALISQALDAADDMGKLAQATGTTVETLSVLSYAAGLSNVSLEQLGQGLEKLSKSAFQAQNGNVQLAAVFNKLGVAVDDGKGHLKDSGVLMEQLAVKFAGMQDGAGKTALAMTLFGRAGAAMIPLLNQYGSEQKKVTEEAQKFGLVLGTSTAELAGHAHDNLDRLKLMFTGIGYSLLGATLPAFDKLVQQLRDIAENANIPDIAKSFGSAVSSAIEHVGNALQFAAKHTTELKIAFEALAGLQIVRIGLPVLAQLSSTSLLGGLSKFATSLFGLQKVMPVLSSIGGWFTAAIPLLGEAGGAALVFETGLAAIGGPVTLVVAAITGLVALVYKFRDAQFSLKGTTYELRDVFSAVWLGIGKAFDWVSEKFGQMVKFMGGLWSGFVGFVKNLPFVSEITGMFDTIITFVANMATKLGSLAPKWATDLLDAAKKNRLASAQPAKIDNKDDKGKGGGGDVVDTTGIHAPKKDKDPYGDLIRSLNQDIEAQKAYLSVLDATPDKIAEVAAAEKAEAEIIKVRNKLIDEGKLAKNGDLSATQKAEIRKKVAYDESLKSLYEYGKVLVDQQRSTQLSIEQTDALAKANLLGDEAVRQATVDNAILALTYGKTTDQIEAMQPELQKLKTLLSQKSESGVLESASKDIFQLQQELDARKGLVAAIIQGVDAEKLALLNQKLFSLEQQISTAATEKEQVALNKKRDLLLQLAQAEQDEADAQAALALKSPADQYNLQVAALQHAVVALQKSNGGTLTYMESLQVAAKEQELFNKQVDDTVNLLLNQDGSASAGVTAFFLNMQKQAKATGAIIYDALNSAFDKLSDNLAELISGGKADFAQMFQDLGKQVASDTIKQQLQTGLGKLGEKLGISLPGLSKRDGSSEASALFVTMTGGLGLSDKDGSKGILGGILQKNGNVKGDGDDLTGGSEKLNDLVGKLGSKLESIFGKLGSTLGSVFGKLAGGLGSIFGSIGGGIGKVFGFLGGLIPHADGGSVSPSTAYLVGERGPEILTNTSGRIYSNTESQQMLSTGSGSGPAAFYSIDARGANAADVEMRVNRSIAASHPAAVRNAVAVQRELQARRPRSKNF